MTNTDNEKGKTQLSKGTIRAGIILGGLAGFVGGLYSMEDEIEFGVLMLSIFFPLLSPVAGLIPAFLMRKIVKEKWVFIFLSIVLGFLAGYLPFNYWFAF